LTCISDASGQKIYEEIMFYNYDDKFSGMMQLKEEGMRTGCTKIKIRALTYIINSSSPKIIKYHVIYIT